MFEYILRQMREKISTLRYVMTIHAEEEMNDDGLSVFDVEHGILTGNITERQKDRVTGEWKYVIEGQSMYGASITVVTKLSITGKLIIITVYLT